MMGSSSRSIRHSRSLPTRRRREARNFCVACCIEGTRGVTESLLEGENRMRRSLKDCLAVAVVATAIWLAGSAQGAHAQIMDRILKDKQIRGGYIPSPPGTIQDPAPGEVKGYYVDG